MDDDLFREDHRKAKVEKTLFFKWAFLCLFWLIFWSFETTVQFYIKINVWTEPLRLNLLGPGNGRVTYLSRFPEPMPKNSL